jgi:hypothetical protein
MNATKARGIGCFQGVCVFRAAVISWLLFLPSWSLAAEHYAVIVSGASGGTGYADKYRGWRETFTRALSELAYASDHLFVLADEAVAGVRPATHENVRAVFAGLQNRVKPDDLVTVLLIGHGTAGDGDEAKFNLMGPDLPASAWLELIKPIAGRVVFINAASGSFPFMRTLSGRNRIVVTSTSASAQQYETVFAEYFVGAFAGLAADMDKNGKVSIWEAFLFSADRVRRWYEERGQLVTERPLLDDNGDGIGREAGEEGADGRMASVTFLQPAAAITEPADTRVGMLKRRRVELERRLETLRGRKDSMPVGDYQAELEELLLEISRVDREIRAETSKN